jgi:hypothetical protein
MLTKCEKVLLYMFTIAPSSTKAPNGIEVERMYNPIQVVLLVEVSIDHLDSVLKVLHG